MIGLILVDSLSSINNSIAEQVACKLYDRGQRVFFTSHIQLSPLMENLSSYLQIPATSFHPTDALDLSCISPLWIDQFSYIINCTHNSDLVFSWLPQFIHFYSLPTSPLKEKLPDWLNQIVSESDVRIRAPFSPS
ncbi:hypothetical protein A11Q_93 [Pseudobdellovibrio exovorus JSS]|uniref:Uncharacterized protein n=1 Tax=Pseudobdellovibrio exovorus JSS TaxID=1184267 RepID=M4V550_9BACT|nr:hypothetical protein A11Q_93 [Pseudobdellovibrio exovorus JSS]